MIASICQKHLRDDACKYVNTQFVVPCHKNDFKDMIITMLSRTILKGDFN